MLLPASGAKPRQDGAIRPPRGYGERVMTNERPEPYQVVARRFRPRTFDELVGQDAVVQSLRSALEAGRVPHAFLFSGSRGVGKTTSARILARAVNCEQGISSQPCGECGSCVSILAGRNPDVVEIDAASHNLVDDVRELRERVGFASMGSRYKVYILDEVHMLTRSAFNAFLKTLEEPPANVLFVLATTELHKVPDTIRSRCQVLLFRRVGEDDVVVRLRAICDKEGLTLADDVLQEIALSCRGGMRDAETALERILPVARERGESFDLATYRRLVHRVGFDRAVEVVESLLGGDAAPAVRFAEEVVSDGIDEREALGEVLEVLRLVLLLLVDGDESALVAARGALRERLQTLARLSDVSRLDAVIQAGLIGRERLRRLDDRRLVFELALLRMAQAGSLPLLGDLVAAVESGGLAAGAPVPVARARSGAAAGAAGGALQGAFLAAVRKVKPMLGSTVEACSLSGPDAEGRAILRLRKASRMHRDRLLSPDVQRLLREVLNDVAGTTVELSIEAGEAEEPARGGRGRAPPGGGPVRRRRRIQGPVPAHVERVRARFEGTLLDSEETDEPGEPPA